MSEHHIKLPEGSIEKTTTTLNLGPTHPATHGVMQNILELDGERIVSTEQTIGYIHRAFEKLAERRPLAQITTLTDRLNYCSSPLNNMGWHLTCEKLLGVKTPKRVDYLRVIIMELASFERNFNDIAFQKLEKFLREYPKVLKEFENLFQRNRIFMERTMGTGAISAERALNYGFTGPNLRAAGVDYDVRVHAPYSSYEDFQFNIPVGTTGDNYDRWLVREKEMWESMQVLTQGSYM